MTEKPWPEYPPKTILPGLHVHTLQSVLPLLVVIKNRDAPGSVLILSVYQLIKCFSSYRTITPKPRSLRLHSIQPCVHSAKNASVVLPPAALFLPDHRDAAERRCPKCRRTESFKNLSLPSIPFSPPAHTRILEWLVGLQASFMPMLLNNVTAQRRRKCFHRTSSKAVVLKLGDTPPDPWRKKWNFCSWNIYHLKVLCKGPWRERPSPRGAWS